MNLDEFKKNYYTTEKGFEDSFQSTVYLIPLGQDNNKKKFDKDNDFDGVLGKLFRILNYLNEKKIDPSRSYIESVIRTRNDFNIAIDSYLNDNAVLPEKRKKLGSVFEDVFYYNEKFRPATPDFIKYLPIDNYEENPNIKTPNSVLFRRAGSNIVASYLYSLAKDSYDNNYEDNILVSTIKKALDQKLEKKPGKEDWNTYYILPFIKDNFDADFSWFMKCNPGTIVSNINTFFYFYLCYSFTQTLLHLKKDITSEDLNKPIKLFVNFDGNSVSSSDDSFKQGWGKKITDSFIYKLYGSIEAIDLYNCLFSKEFYNFSQINEHIKTQNIDLDVLKNLLIEIDSRKKYSIGNRPSSNHDCLSIEVDCNITSIEEFPSKLLEICRTHMDSQHGDRISRGLHSLMDINWLKKHRNYWVIEFDKKMMLFIISMIIKDKEKILLSELYEKLKNYGFDFDSGNRGKIEEYLSELDLLIKKSDSERAIYVKRFL